MRKIYSIYMILFLLVAMSGLSSAQVQTDKVKPYKVAICHKGQVMWISSAALPSHLAHGDALAVQNSAGEWVCPCPPTTRPPRTYCPDGSLQQYYWDNANCKWIPIDCPPCEPKEPAPVTYCPDGTPQHWVWDTQNCKWVPKDCPPCQPTEPRPYTICADGTILYWDWDPVHCKWMPKDCPPCQPTDPRPYTVCADGTILYWDWDYTLCKWMPKDCPQPCDPRTTPKPDCPTPGVQCCWQWSQTDCKWISIPCPTNLPPCPQIIFGQQIWCDCLMSDGTIILCNP